MYLSNLFNHFKQIIVLCCEFVFNEWLYLYFTLLFFRFKFWKNDDNKRMLVWHPPRTTYSGTVLCMREKIETLISHSTSSNLTSVEPIHYLSCPFKPPVTHTVQHEPEYQVCVPLPFTDFEYFKLFFWFKSFKLLVIVRLKKTSCN